MHCGTCGPCSRVSTYRKEAAVNNTDDSGCHDNSKKKKKKLKQKTHTTHTFEAAGLVFLHNSSLKERLINTAYAAW